MRILEEKGHLKHKKRSREFVFCPTRPRERAGKSAFQRVLETFFEGSLEKAVAARPKDPNGQLYLGLAYLKKNDPARAVEHLAALRGLSIDPRLAEQVDRALEVIRKEPLTEPVRNLLASNLDTAADLAREAAEARRDAQLAFPPPYMGYPYFGSPFYGYPFGSPYTPCVLVMRGGQPFCI